MVLSGVGVYNLPFRTADLAPSEQQHNSNPPNRHLWIASVMIRPISRDGELLHSQLHMSATVHGPRAG